MKRPNLRTLALIGGAAFLALAGAYLLMIRPWHLTWGATDEEVRRPMPGDAIHASPSFNATRAVTIEAGPEHIWPWLVQMGYRRAGFYSYDRIDNAGIPSADHIIPEYQSLKVGDRVPMAPNAYAEVREMDPHHSMLWVFRGEGQWENATWAPGEPIAVNALATTDGAMTGFTAEPSLGVAGITLSMAVPALVCAGYAFLLWRLIRHRRKFWARPRRAQWRSAVLYLVLGPGAILAPLILLVLVL